MYNSFKKFLPIVILFSSLLVAACSGTSGGDSDVVAKVGSKDIKLVDVDRLIKQQLDQSPGTVLTPAELAAARFTVLDQMIQEEVMFQKAQKDNLVPDDAKVNQELQRQKQQGGVTEEQWQASLKQAGLSEEEAKDKLRRQLAIAALQDKEKTRVASPTDDEVKKYFEDHRNEFVAQRGVEFSMIIVDPRNNGLIEDAIGDGAAEAKAQAIHTQLKGGGTDFATLASQRSEDTSTNIRGGKVGFATEDQLKQSFPSRPEIPTRLMSMTPGQYTEPIKDNLSGAWYIFKVDNRREQAENLTLDNPQVRQSIVDTLLSQRQRVLFNALMVTALSEANVKNHLAERIVEDPKRIADMKPSALLQQTLQQQPAPTPRVENQNQAAPATANGNNTSSANRSATPAANTNTRPASANTNR